MPTFDNVWTPAFDIPASPVNRSVVIISTPRTGSQALCRLLYRAGLGIPAEYFLPSVITNYCIRFLGHRQPLTPAFMGAYARATKELRSRHGVFSYKIHADQHRSLAIDLGCAFEDRLPHPLIIRLRRRDKVAQVVSLGTALQTGIWENAAAPYRLRKWQGLGERMVLRWTEYIFSSERYWDRYVGQTGNPIVSIFQEDLQVPAYLDDFLIKLDSPLMPAAISEALARPPSAARVRGLTETISRRYGSLIAQHWTDLQRRETV